MKITRQFLIDNDACEDGVDAFTETFGGEADLKDVAAYGLREGGDMLGYVMWLLPRCMNKEQCVRYAVFAAESVLPVYEREYPEDKLPRAAIDAAKAWLAEPCGRTARAARAEAAAAAAAEAAAAAAAREAWAAEAAWAAAEAAEAAEAAWADKDLKPALVDFALELLEGK